jgi:hypothetical protein
MSSTRLRRMTLILAVLVCALAFAGCTSVADLVNKPACAYKVIKVVEEGAELTEFYCQYKKFDGEDSMWFMGSVKNLTKEEQRYKVNIFLDSGKAVGGLIPRKTNKGLVKPGQSMSFKYPAKGQTDTPQEVTVHVKTMSK